MRRTVILLLSVLLFGSVSSQNFEKINISSNLESPNMIETVDLNGDGLDDYIIAGSEKFYWYENMGNAQFTPHSLVDSLQGFWRFSLFDWENDGDLDIFFTTFIYGSQKVAWLENDSNQNFTYHLINDTIPSPYYIQPFDIDKDNDVDILVSSSSTDQLYWLNNDGLSNFDIDTIGNYVNQFEIADLDGDNDWDIIFGRAYTGVTISEVRAHQNDGNNNFSMITLKSGFSNIHEIIVEDVNGDNYFDIVVPEYTDDKIVWLKNDGNYNFSNQLTIISSFNGPEGIELKDVNQDGKKDIIAGSYQSGQLYYFQGIGTQSSYSFSSGSLISGSVFSVSDLAIGNFDNQNKLDFVHTNKVSDAVSIWINNGSQSFTENQLHFSFDSPRAFDMEDLDGDGDQDVAAVSNDGDMVAWMENLGDDVFKTHILLTNYEEPYVVRINDLDEDGDFDIIAASNDDDRVTWWKNDGSGNFTMAHLTTNVNGPRDLWIEDYDGDGDKDVAVICYWLYNIVGNSGAQLLKNDGNENFTLHEIDEDVRSGRSMRGADMNGDSLTDIVISSYYYTNSKLRIATNNGTGFGIVTVGSLLCEDFEVIDFDGDNDIDILAIDANLDSLYFYENTGNWQFSRHTVGYIQDLYGIHPADFDHDGDIDVIFSTGYSGFTNSSSYEWGIFRNDGSGNLTVEIWEQNLSMIKPMQVFDYQRDGDHDIMLGFDYADKIVLHKNLEVDCYLSVDAIANGNTMFCDGGSVQLQALTTDTGITYQWFNDTIALLNDTLSTINVDSSGLYRVEIADTSCGVSSLKIEVVEHPVYSEEVYQTICKGDVLVVDTATIITAGDYTFNLQSQYGCDSTVLIHVSVADTHRVVLNHSICSSDVFSFGGSLLNQTGVFYDTLQNSNGCDSIIQLNLTVYPEYFAQLSADICTGESYNFNGSVLSLGGVYYDTIPTINGCDSVFVLTLTVNPVYSVQETQSICAGSTYDFNGTFLSQTGIYHDTVPSVNGCDSILELNLTVYPVYTTPLADTICFGDFFDFNGQILTQAGTYHDTLQTVNGCDSILELSLTVNPIYTIQLNDTICFGDVFDFNGNMISQAGIYYDTLPTVNGCDSVLELNLTVNPVYSIQLAEEICEGNSYNFNGNQLYSTGIYKDTLQSMHGCDSIITLDLTVNHIDSVVMQQEICEGDSVIFEGQYYSQTGMYPVTSTNTNGCDSINILDLTVNPLPMPFLGNDTTIDDTVLIILNPGVFASYLWQDGSINPTYLVDGPALGDGTFTFNVEVADLNSCTGSDTIEVIILETIGIGEHSSKNIIVYPNPVKNYLHIRSTQTLDCELKLYDATGRLVLSKSIDESSDKIDMGTLSTGDYYLHLIFNDYRKVIPLIKL